MINRIHAAPYAYPSGWAYRRWAAGAILPPLFLAPAFYYADWAALGVAAPDPGFQWVRYGPDLVLVNVTTGEIVDVVYGAFYEPTETASRRKSGGGSADPPPLALPSGVLDERSRATFYRRKSL